MVPVNPLSRPSAPGVTTPAEWALMRQSPAPWAELEFENIIFTVPSDAIRHLERPEEVAALWDKIMRGVADLAAVSHKFPRKERFVAEVQISCGESPFFSFFYLPLP